MPSPFGGLNMLGNALRVFQRGLEVTGHNIANVNTPGYSRQRMELGTNRPDTVFGNRPYLVGTGVNVQTISRARSFFLDRQANNATSEFGRYETLAMNLRQVEGAFPEPGDNGISAALNKFFDAWSALASNPNDPAARLQVQSAGQSLTMRVRNTYAALDTQGTEVKREIDATFDQIDGLTAHIGRLNEEIVARQAGGGIANDLLDARDAAIAELSGLIPVQTYAQPDGMMTVYSGERLLVPGSQSIPIPRTYNAANLTLSDGQLTSSVGSGRLAGLLQTLHSVQTYQSRLDDLANQMRTEINAIHRTGTTVGGSTGIDFFNAPDPLTGAVDFALSAEVASDPANIIAGASGAAGDGSIALTLSRMRSQDLAGLGGKSFGAFYTELVSQVGRDSAYYASSLDSQGAVLDQIEQQRQAVIGVNLDDEMTQMMQFQRSYQAAARALSVMDEVAEDLVNMLR